MLPPLEPGPPLGGIGPLSGPWTLSCNGPFLSGVGPLSGMGPLLSGPLGPLSLLIGRLRSLDDLEFGSSFLGLFAGLWTFRGSFCFLGILYWLLGSSGVNSFSFSAFSAFLAFLIFLTSSRIEGGIGGVLPDLHCQKFFVK